MNDLNSLTQEIRRDIIKMIYTAGSGHPGGSLSSVEFFVSLFFGGIKKPEDYFILSNGHVCPAWYATLAHAEVIKHEQLLTLREFCSPLQGHPEKGRLPQILTTTGSLGQGICVAVGLALGLKRKKMTQRVFCLTSDGEQDEGSVWEAARIASHYSLDNLYLAVDRDMMQIGGKTEEVSRLEPLLDKYLAFGFDAWEIDGHNLDEINSAFNETSTQYGKPKVVILKTIRGKGVSFMEGDPRYHAKTITAEEYQKAMGELNAA
ncbi:transketolase [Candidatus Microgenomates bacterium]|nr:transketolase [Candidatus Microgenomates bacterium]